MESLQKVTYSPAYTIVPTYECFNRCSYCNFRTEPSKSPWLELDEAEKLLSSLQNTGTLEILILSGEVHPQSQRRAAWFQRIYDICQLALEMGFLPHTNVGPLSFAEMTQLKQVNVSMGLMLEQLTPALLQSVHKHAPSKQPQLRLQQLQWAGQLQIPFTTGLLLGIGETLADSQNTLQAIAEIHGRWGNIQEVILQPYSPGTNEEYKLSAFPIKKLPEIIALARQILPSEITIQIPPNLISQPALLIACIEAGARDLGGIGPWDEVNPDYPHPPHQKLADILQTAGWQLVQRLPVYPQHINTLPSHLQKAISQTLNLHK
ncbi:7,8-didemethyl-8-hydroxy-5-deazariboflavin synthase subunit CofG [Ancylothrix sp. C2]|uniref:7,8-didemethyl-8-hydroxy-5-deazariboflavin synthase subunit CofG n=1 Tax=Ancylothrix sp. D3o TaxID=2953691 RepID=UPI0021BAE82F|nr:7,8-didemethyl-8-hydroxy-5-deazariboflavin synthase subunit CofG [Ancylothrix sp. D3o]MCT7951615.1 7,8-didemethyl-8-hydroxy-5-deazariboflavin synthase subunit CofG [Ancylothrix sp. D3o]